MHTSVPTTNGHAAPASRTRLGDSTFHLPAGDVSGEHVLIDGEPYACIRNVDALPPFLMSVVSNSDVWIFAGSNTPFCAGRSHPDQALFPYQTADKILENLDSSGAMTLLLIEREDGHWALWEPWRPSGRLYRISRNLYKHAHGSSILFEEINHDLGLRLRWSLTSSEEFGIVRRAELANLSSQGVNVRYLDGWHRLLPSGVSQELYARYSYLAAAYMRHEREKGSALGIYTLNSRVTDRSDPAEALRASCAWSLGHSSPCVLLSTRQVEAFRRNEELTPETEVRAAMGAYLVAGKVSLTPGGAYRWTTVADTGLDHSAVVTLRRRLTEPQKLETAVEESITANQRGLHQRIAAADGLQETADRPASIHHFANVLFNCMRGGTFIHSYAFPSADFAQFLKARNRKLHTRYQPWLEGLPATLTLPELSRLAASQGDAQLDRLAGEYLPLTFSRRHGDPSRPWNRFAIRIRNENGEAIYDYQGNWRDIFQNWEGLSTSYPAALERMIAVFLNASTADGYNPYRVTRDGIDWEILDHEDPWSHIGYWGDHQLIYLLRLLQACEQYYPGLLASRLGEARYAYAQVPYEISDFAEIVRNPGNSIRFNDALHKALLTGAEELGNDGKLRHDADGNVALASLAEKLLVPLLAKLSNLVPEGGIWMNTQRPDWNDANNALVGWGLSMVTVCQMRPYIQFVDRLFAAASGLSYQVPAALRAFAVELAAILKRAAAQPTHDAAERYTIVEALGRAGEKHRNTVYSGKPDESVNLSVAEIRALLADALRITDATIRANRREDGLYHSYNLLELADGRAEIRRFPLMLEGQVSVLSSGLLDAQESLTVLQGLVHSDLYRADQHSFMLYPDREIAPFLSRNTLPATWARRAPVLDELAVEGNRDLVVVDETGHAHFQGDLTNEGDLQHKIDLIARDPARTAAVTRDRAAILALWEEVFEHSLYRGRSGTMFGFEGLGSIYWHMVAKLLLAAQETCQRAIDEKAPDPLVKELTTSYYDIRRGLGFTKTPQVYGAFPSDPYSHSPRHAGAQQPGMTGQVKEEILTRRGELGVGIVNGSIRFRPVFLRRDEFFSDAQTFSYVGLDGSEKTCAVPAEGLAFTCCQVPVVYQLADEAAITVERGDETVRLTGDILSPRDSAALFARDGSIHRIVVQVPRDHLLAA